MTIDVRLARIGPAAPRRARPGRPRPAGATRTPPSTPAAVSPTAGAGGSRWRAGLLRATADLLDVAGDAVAALARLAAGTVDDPRATRDRRGWGSQGA